MKHRDTYQRFKGLVNHQAVDKKTSYFLGLFGKYFDLDQECQTIPVASSFASWFWLQQSLKPETRELYEMLLPRIAQEAPPSVEAVLVPRLVELDVAYRAANLVTRYTGGEELDFTRELRQLSEDAEHSIKSNVKLPIVELDDDLFADDINGRGFQWRWDCLNSNMRPLMGGDFVVFAARPDQGKTSALADNVTHFATQFEHVYPEDGHERVWLWLNNEGPSKRVQKRIIQSALNRSTSEVNELVERGLLWDAYDQAIGNRSRIRVLSIHGYFSWQVEELLKRFKVAGIVFDMVDNVKFTGVMTNGGTRTDQILEEMYKWARDLAVILDCPVIATSQTPGDAEGVPYPTLGQLKDSKTGKQGACDAIITMGNSPDPALAAVRFIGQTKNKLQLEGAPKSCQRKIILNPATGRFSE